MFHPDQRADSEMAFSIFSLCGSICVHHHEKSIVSGIGKVIISYQHSFLSAQLSEVCAYIRRAVWSGGLECCDLSQLCIQKLKLTGAERVKSGTRSSDQSRALHPGASLNC
jgi:hypothetical protein